MNPIADKIDEFLKQFDELEKLNADASKEHSDIDKALSSWYHKVEGLDITHVSISHKLIKEVKGLLIRRRDIKLESMLLRSTCDTLREKVKTLKGSNKNVLAQNEKVRLEIKTRATE
jgi:hypothetical protein